MIQPIRRTFELKRLDALKAVLYLNHNITSSTEISLVCELIKHSNGQSLTADNNLKPVILKATGIPKASLSTTLCRIEKTGAIQRQGKTIIFNPAICNFMEINQVLLKISADK